MRIFKRKVRSYFLFKQHLSNAGELRKLLHEYEDKEEVLCRLYERSDQFAKASLRICVFP